MTGCTTLSVLFITLAVGQSGANSAAVSVQVAESGAGTERAEWQSVMVPLHKEAHWDGAAARLQTAASQPERTLHHDVLTHASELNGLEPPPLSLDPVELAPVGPTPLSALQQFSTTQVEMDSEMVTTTPEPPMVQSKRPAYRRDFTTSDGGQSQVSEQATIAKPLEIVTAEESAESAAAGQEAIAVEDEVGEPRTMTKRPAYRYSGPQDNEPQRSIAPSSWPYTAERTDKTT